MKAKKILCMLLGFACATALAQSSDRVSSSIDVSAAPPMTQIQAKTENGITYMCGGVGASEADAMKQAASDYDLMLTFSAANGAYLADVSVDIADSRGRSIVQTTCDAPIMLVDFEKGGTYRVRAETSGHTINRTVQVRGGGKVKNLAMSWPTKVVDMGTSPNIRTEQMSGSSGSAGMRGGQGDAASGGGSR